MPFSAPSTSEAAAGRSSALSFFQRPCGPFQSRACGVGQALSMVSFFAFFAFFTFYFLLRESARVRFSFWGAVGMLQMVADKTHHLAQLLHSLSQPVLIPHIDQLRGDIIGITGQHNHIALLESALLFAIA
jgi:hypothetical protein